MWRSLRARIFVVIAIVAIGTAAAIGLVSRRVTLSEFDRYVGAADAARVTQARAMLAGYQYQDDGWRSLAVLLDRINETEHVHVLAIEPSGTVAAAAPRDLMQANVVIEADDGIHLSESDHGLVKETVFKGPKPVTIRRQDGVEALRCFLLPETSDTQPVDRRVFVGSVTRGLLLAAFVVCALAIAAASLTSRRVLGPIEALTIAAKRLGAGDLHGRVDARASDEIGDLGRAFNSMADSLSRAEGLRRNMANDIAHELRTPLSNIRCQLEAMQDGLVVSSAEVINSLHDEAMHLIVLVDDLQDLALAEANQLRLSPEPLALREEIARAVQAMTRGGKAPRIVVDVPESMPAVMADPRRLRQILSNLLSNAIRHTPADGRIDVSARLVGPIAEVLVHDTGSGIAAEHLSQVFDRFYRADPSRERSTGGAGLGLTIVRQLVRAHGGDVRVESVVGAGSTFLFTLPPDRAAIK